MEDLNNIALSAVGLFGAVVACVVAWRILNATFRLTHRDKTAASSEGTFAHLTDYLRF